MNKLVRVVSGAGASSPHLLNKPPVEGSSRSSSKWRELMEWGEGRQDVDIEAEWTNISRWYMKMSSGWALIASCSKARRHGVGILTENACPYLSMSSLSPPSLDETATSQVSDASLSYRTHDQQAQLRRLRKSPIILPLIPPPPPPSHPATFPSPSPPPHSHATPLNAMRHAASWSPGV